MTTRLALVATGGTIQNTPAGRVDVSTVWDRIAQYAGVELPDAELVVHDVLRQGAESFGPTEWQQITDAVQTSCDDAAVDAVVVTHGTFTAEESAYLLHLVIDTGKPVVVTVSQRKHSTIGNDGDRNLLDAVRVACAATAAGHGVLVVANEEIHCAREVTKEHQRPGGFVSPPTGPLGTVETDVVSLYRGRCAGTRTARCCGGRTSRACPASTSSPGSPAPTPPGSSRRWRPAPGGSCSPASPTTGGAPTPRWRSWRSPGAPGWPSCSPVEVAADGSPPRPSPTTAASPGPTTSRPRKPGSSPWSASPEAAPRRCRSCMTPIETASGRPRLTDHVIVVTGGGHGIGRAYCRRLADEGAHVVIADLDGDAAAAVAAAIVAAGGSAVGHTCDVRDLGALVAVVDDAESRFGGVDGLINNAGMMVLRPISRVGFESIPEDEWDEAMDINLKGTWLGCRAVAPAMRRRGGGSIVNVGSGTFFLGPPTRAHYVASKGGVMALTRVLSRELAADGIRINTLVPGSTLSEDDPSEEVVAMRAQPIAGRSIKRIEVPEDLVGAAVFFLSADSAFVTGQSLVVDGGGILH